MMRRKKYETLLAHASAKEFSILIGARQTGKSTLLRQLADMLTTNGEVVTLLNLDRKDILLELNQTPENVFKYSPLQADQKCMY